jgi:hypothetical protein
MKRLVSISLFLLAFLGCQGKNPVDFFYTEYDASSENPSDSSLSSLFSQNILLKKDDSTYCIVDGQDTIGINGALSGLHNKKLKNWKAWSATKNQGVVTILEEMVTNSQYYPHVFLLSTCKERVGLVMDSIFYKFGDVADSAYAEEDKKVAHRYNLLVRFGKKVWLGYVGFSMEDWNGGRLILNKKAYIDFCLCLGLYKEEYKVGRLVGGWQ